MERARGAVPSPGSARPPAGGGSSAALPGSRRRSQDREPAGQGEAGPDRRAATGEPGPGSGDRMTASGRAGLQAEIAAPRPAGGLEAHVPLPGAAGQRLPGAKTVTGRVFVQLRPSNRDRKARAHPGGP